MKNISNCIHDWQLFSPSRRRRTTGRSNSIMSGSHSNIQVLVQWAEQTVFAGEDVECRITFKNITTVNNNSRLSQNSPQNGYSPGDDRQRKQVPLQGSAAQNRINSISNSRPPPPNRGHRSTLSLNVPIGDINRQRGTRMKGGGTSEGTTEERSHRRSVSILSLGVIDASGEEARSQKSFGGETSRNPPKRHGRAASLQIVPRRNGMNGGPPSGKSLHYFHII